MPRPLHTATLTLDRVSGSTSHMALEAIARRVLVGPSRESEERERVDSCV